MDTRYITWLNVKVPQAKKALILGERGSLEAEPTESIPYNIAFI